MPELLLEILSEEIPARMQAKAAADLKRLVCDGLKAAGLDFTSAEAYVTPRRLALVVDGLREETDSEPITQKGPKIGAPEQAIQGFLNKVGRSSIDDENIRIVNSPKGDFYEFYALAAPKPAESVLRSLIPDVLDALPWPKSMRWANTDVRWVRPIHGIMAVFNSQLLPLDWDLIRTVEAINNPTNETRIESSNSTVGHRFLAPDTITVSDFADYKAKLDAAKVMLDPAERRAKIEADAKAWAATEGLSLKDDPGLLDEVTGLVEWPVVLMGTIEDQFMDLPAEVLTTSMRSHQKYFACLTKDAGLANRFIVVANTETKDGGQQVVAGNERVLRARLSDAKFFWDQDRSIRLEERSVALKDRVFHAKLGTIDDKIERMVWLAESICEGVGADRALSLQAVKLCKNDLSTGMVGEFPELQGVMGRYYAMKDDEAYEVADAIAEHYSPLGPTDNCPSKPVSVCTALADKIDTLVSFWFIGEKPTGSKDPFALRRAALGVLRLILENGIRVSLAPIFDAHIKRLLKQDMMRRGFETSQKLKAIDEEARAGFVYAESVPAKFGDGSFDSRVVDLLDFFADRLKVHLKEQGVRHDLIDAVFALGGEDDLVRLIKRVEALQAFLASEDGGNLLTAYKRAANILRIEEKKDGKTYSDTPDVAAFVQDEERALAAGLDGAGPQIAAALADEDFAAAMTALAALRGPVDAFFDAVTVNADDAALRVNRLKLLNGIRASLDGVADFSKIEG